MKKIRLIALLLLICLLAAPAALADYKSGDLFVDSMSGASFIVPDGWNQFDLELTAEDTYVSFDTAGTVGLVCFYSADLFAGVEGMLNGQNITRAEINNDNFLTPADAADSMNVRESDLEIMTFGGIEFYTCTTVNYDLGEEMQMFSAMACHNGYLYSVDFMGPDGSYMPAALELLETFRP